MVRDTTNGKSWAVGQIHQSNRVSPTSSDLKDPINENFRGKIRGVDATPARATYSLEQSPRAPRTCNPLISWIAPCLWRATTTLQHSRPHREVPQSHTWWPKLKETLNNDLDPRHNIHKAHNSGWRIQIFGATFTKKMKQHLYNHRHHKHLSLYIYGKKNSMHRKESTNIHKITKILQNAQIQHPKMTSQFPNTSETPTALNRKSMGISTYCIRQSHSLSGQKQRTQVQNLQNLSQIQATQFLKK